MALLVHDERLGRRVGVVVLVVTAAVVVFVATVRDRLRTSGVEIAIRFGGPTGLREGAAVRLAGRDVGEVTAVSLAPGDGGVLVLAELDPAWAARIPKNAEIFVGARSLLAPRYLEIAPPRAAPERGFAERDVVRGVDPPDLDRILQRVWDNLTELRGFQGAIAPGAERLDAALARLSWILDRVAPDLAPTVDALRGAADEIVALAGELDGLDPRLLDRARATVARVEAAITDLRARAARLAAAIAVVRDRLPADLVARVELAVAAIDRATAGATTLAAEARGLLADATTGAGTLAAFARDLELFDDLKAVVKQMKRRPWRVVVP